MTTLTTMTHKGIIKYKIRAIHLFKKIKKNSNNKKKTS